MVYTNNKIYDYIVVDRKEITYLIKLFKQKNINDLINDLEKIYQLTDKLSNDKILFINWKNRQVETIKEVKNF